MSETATLLQKEFDQFKKDYPTEQIEEFGLKLRELITSGKCKDSDLEHLNLDLSHRITLMTFIRKGSGMYLSEAVKLGRKRQMLSLTLLNEDDELFSLLHLVMQKLNSWIDLMFQGNEDEEIVAFLRSLPDWDVWDKTKAKELLNNSKFKDSFLNSLKDGPQDA